MIEVEILVAVLDQYVVVRTLPIPESNAWKRQHVFRDLTFQEMSIARAAVRYWLVGTKQSGCLCVNRPFDLLIDLPYLRLVTSSRPLPNHCFIKVTSGYVGCL